MYVQDPKFSGPGFLNYIDLNAVDHHDEVTGEIRLPGIGIGDRDRIVRLSITPLLRQLLAVMKLQAGGAKFVFPNLSHNIIENARERLVGIEPVEPTRKPSKKKAEQTPAPRARKKVDSYGAPSFDWQILRSTCATYMTNAPNIFGDAAHVLSARRLGHRTAGGCSNMCRRYARTPRGSLGARPERGPQILFHNLW